jgi:hypothetical protein
MATSSLEEEWREEGKGKDYLLFKDTFSSGSDGNFIKTDPVSTADGYFGF